MSPEISELICRVREGSEPACQELWDRYSGRILGVTRLRVGKKQRRFEDHEDIAAKTLESFILGIQRGRINLGDQSSVFPLLRQIAINKAANSFERESAKKRGGLNVRGDSAVEIDAPDKRTDHTVLHEISDQWLNAFKRLRVEWQEVVKLKAEGLSNDEIVRKSGRSKSTVERYLAESELFLRKVLAEE